MFSYQVNNFVQVDRTHITGEVTIVFSVINKVTHQPGISPVVSGTVDDYACVA
jgi:hypothetical protein